MNTKDTLQYVTGMDLWQQQRSRERELHADGMGDPDALPLESGLATGYEIYKQRIMTIGKMTGRLTILGMGGGIVAEAATLLVRHI